MYQTECDSRFYDGYAAERRLRQRLQGDAPVIERTPRRNTKAAAHAAAFFCPKVSAPVAQAPDQLARTCCDSCTTKALSALCSRWRSLRPAAQRPQTQATRGIRSNAITGFTTAAPPIAGCASGYREMRLLSNFPRRNAKAAAHAAAFFVPGVSAPVAQAPDQLAEPAATAARPRRYWPCVAAGAACARLRSGRKPRQRGVSDRTG